LYIDVRVELVDEERGHLGADRLVLEQFAAGLGPVVGIQDLAVRPQREDRQESEQARDDDQDGRQGAPALCPVHSSTSPRSLVA
jgi:hypothetical protein